MGGVTTGIPVERVLNGERFSIEYAPVERALSRKAGGIHFASPTSMRNEFSTIRMYTKVPGSMLNKKLAVGIPVVRETANGYTHDTMTMWINTNCSQVA